MVAQVIPAELVGVRKHFGPQIALDGIDLRLVPGELTALLGPNGAGKSTAVGLLLGLHDADRGTVSAFGHAPRSLLARRRAGVMLQSAGVPDAIKVRELVELTRAYYPQPRIFNDCVAMAGLDGLLDRRYGTLSGGQQRRVQFAMAICGRPEALYLDEPTTGLDIDARQRLWATIRSLIAEGCAVLLTTHYLEEAEALADRVVVLNRGRVVAAGSVDEIRGRVAQRTIRCRSNVRPQDVATWPGIHRATLEDGRLTIVATSAETIVRRLFAEDAGLSDLEVRRADLGEAFVELTREAA